MKANEWFCIYFDYHDKAHSQMFQNKMDAVNAMQTIKRRIQKSSADETVTVLDKDDYYAMATNYGMQIIGIMHVGWDADLKLRRQ